MEIDAKRYFKLSLPGRSKTAENELRRRLTLPRFAKAKMFWEQAAVTSLQSRGKRLKTKRRRSRKP